MDAFLENLESRKLFSVSLSNGTLTINGSAHSDHITIYRSAATRDVHVKVNNEIRSLRFGQRYKPRCQSAWWK